MYLEGPDGRVVAHESEWDDADRDILVFMFEDGNYACDCNRSTWLCGADVSWPCGDSIRVLSLLADGVEVYREELSSSRRVGSGTGTGEPPNSG